MYPECLELPKIGLVGWQPTHQGVTLPSSTWRGHTNEVAELAIEMTVLMYPRTCHSCNSDNAVSVVIISP
jgi:hypothetical protein